MSAAEWTLDEAASWLDPPISAGQLRAFIRELSIKHTGRRATGHTGPGVKTYDAVDLMNLHAALAPWLVRASLTRNKHP